ncbi:protein of unknown function [Cyanobium sp. NIES-981]|nr:protein of unknown function [Cyanobium sp. NIES-981]
MWLIAVIGLTDQSSGAKAGQAQARAWEWGLMKKTDWSWTGFCWQKPRGNATTFAQLFSG